MKKLIILLCLGLLVACDNADDELIREQQEKMVAEQPIENPFFGEGAVTDVDVSDEELREFVLLNMEFGKIRVEAQQKGIEILRDEDLTMDRYNSMSNALSMGLSVDENNFSETDIDKFERAKEKISALEEEVDEQIESKIEQSDFTMDRYMDLNVAANHDEEIKERARDIALNLALEEEQE